MKGHWKDYKHEIEEVSYAGKENPYYAAFLSLKCDLLVVEELNAVVPEAIKHLASKKETIFNLMDAFLQEIKKSEFAENEANGLLGKIREKLDVEKRIIRIARQAQDEAKTKGIKLAYFGFDEKTAVGKTLLDEIRYHVFPRKFTTFIRNMSLVYLVALFENYLGKVLQITMQNEPKVLMTCQKSITIEELLKLNDIEEAKKQVIEKEISAIVNEDLDRLAKYFEDKFNLKLAETSDWSQFKERFYRRNIIIHNSGYPNKTYRHKTGYRGKNKKMDVSEDYLRYSIKLFSMWAFYISMYLNQKFLKT